MRDVDRRYEAARLATLCKVSHAAMMHNWKRSKRLGRDDRAWTQSVEIWLKACEALLKSSTEGEDR